MTVTVTATRTVTNPPDTPNRIPPPPDPAGVTTAAGDAGRPGVLIEPGLRWPPVACQGMGDWPFFGPDTERAVSRARRVAQAKAICASCAALVRCRVFALRTGQVSGIWGGLSEEERGHAVPVRVPPGRQTTSSVPGSSPAAAGHVR